MYPEHNLYQEKSLSCTKFYLFYELYYWFVSWKTNLIALTLINRNKK